MTAEHPFYVINKGWIKVKDLKVGDSIKSSSKNPVRIVSIKKGDRNITVYNIKVADNNNYFVTSSKLLVHNKDIEDEPLNMKD